MYEKILPKRDTDQTFEVLCTSCVLDSEDRGKSTGSTVVGPGIRTRHVSILTYLIHDHLVTASSVVQASFLQHIAMLTINGSNVRERVLVEEGRACVGE
jgi:hypothetical protein